MSGGTVYSANWSGYAVYSKNRTVTGVTGTFVVPHAGLFPVPGFAATWAGIGGYKRPKHSLIQAGTGEDSFSGPPFGRKYFAWYELLPAPEKPLRGCSGDQRCKVSPGNHITVTIRRLAVATWRISVTNAGHWSWSKQVHYNSSRSSAEWILEAPKVGGAQQTLAPVGTVHFGPTSKYRSQGVTHKLAQGNPTRIILTGEAKPSAIAADGQSFNDCSYRSGTCPRP